MIVLADGMADYPCPELGGLTPLAYARTPHMDRLAAQGTVGQVKTVPDGFPPGSDVANLAVLGYDPRECYTGRAPLEAASMGVALGPEDVAFRCNLVTLSDDEPYAAKVMVDYSAGEISSAEARELIGAVQERLGSGTVSFYAGVSYRHLMVWRGGPAETSLTPPHDITGRVIGEYLPRGEGGEFLRRLMEESAGFLPGEAVNRRRVAEGKRPANSLWFWGQGRRPQLAPFREKYGLAGSVIAAVDLIRGIGVLAGMRVPVVPGATGNLHTDYRAKARAALNELAAGQDFVFIHVEAADEAGHQGDVAAKVKAIEEIDAKVVGVVVAALQEAFPRWRVMILPDHPTPLPLKTHTAEPVPFAIADSGAAGPGAPGKVFSEAAAAAAGLEFLSGPELLAFFLGRADSSAVADR
ncbi:cofactor-independent phosphoglycerate mutase [Thermodesulfitimonas autotrophica]|uniref:cofactor-independent phosphoglycerate mutase n=1 Tax=Thermodesulfitimonas autotrophica TaxID=1894989 RepID=UPI001FE41B81|nr:cofactor-independent phosphoglycerate mutase [Thermodesulfitimonas autotrophica]